MSETMRVGASANTPPAMPRTVVDVYRQNGTLDAPVLAESLIEMAAGDPARLAELKAAFEGTLTPLERGSLERSLDYAQMGVIGHIGDGLAQVGKGLWGMVKGLGQMAWGLGRIAYDDNLIGRANDLLERHTGVGVPDFLPSQARGQERAAQAAATVKALGEAIWDDPSILLQEYKDLNADGRYGAIAGRLLVDVGDLFISTKGAGKAGRVAGIAGDLGRVGNAGQVVRAADTAADFARAARAAPDEAVDALIATRATLSATDPATLSDDAARSVQRAIDEIDTTLDAAATGRARPGVVERLNAYLKADADPARAIFGSATSTHPAEIAAMCRELEAAGVEVRMRTDAMAYSPGLREGQPGQFHIDPNASYSAWKHEYQHFLDDKAAGWGGMRGLMDADNRWAMEQSAYAQEIAIAREAGQPELVAELEALLEAERVHIFGE